MWRRDRGELSAACLCEAIGAGGDFSWPPPRPDGLANTAEIAASGLFDDVQIRRYVWQQAYTADQYVALLDTFSRHIAMEPGGRDHVHDEIRRRISSRAGPRGRRHWYSIPHMAQRA